MQTARLWFARIIMTYALLIFAFLSYLYIIEPLEHIAGFGISASGVPESINFLRAGPGALFLGMTLFAAYGLVRPGYLRNCLLVLVIFNACVVAVRLFGITLDGGLIVEIKAPYKGQASALWQAVEGGEIPGHRPQFMTALPVFRPRKRRERAETGGPIRTGGAAPLSRAQSPRG